MPEHKTTSAWIVKHSVSHQKLRDIGGRLIWVRERMGQTQAEFARYLQLRVEMLNRWEKGTRQPNLDLLCIFCRQTGATLDFILDGRIGPAMHDELLKAWISEHVPAAFAAAVWQSILKSRAEFAAILAAAHLPAPAPDHFLASARPRRKKPRNDTSPKA